MSELILVIDDSALMRKHLREMLTDAGYSVETARNGEEGLEKLEELEPALITLDVNMPVMDGITCLSIIMEKKPTPVIMVSSITDKGAIATLEALELGAVDYISKPGGTVSLNIRDIETELLSKIDTVISANISHSGKRFQSDLPPVEKSEEPQISEDQAVIESLARKNKLRVESIKNNKFRPKDLGYSMVIMGVSTGGPGTIEEIVLDLPNDFPLPIIVVQHMPAKFTKVFSDRLNKVSSLPVIELSEPTEPKPAHVYIAKGEADIKFTKRMNKTLAINVPTEKSYTWHPSVERAVESAIEVFDPRSLICVQLTGMGNDGAKAMAKAHSLGARTIAESEDTAVVFGMCKALIQLEGAECVLPSYKIAGQLMKWV